MNDINFHIENIKRSIHAIADLNLEDPDNKSALMELTTHPIFQMLFQVKVQYKDIYERELSELIGLEHGSVSIAHAIFDGNYNWGFNRNGDFSVNNSEGYYRSPIPTFVFRIVEKDDEFNAEGFNLFTVGFIQTGTDLINRVKFITSDKFQPHEMVTILARLAPDFKVFVVKQ